MISASAFILIGGKSDRFGSQKWQSIIAGKSVFDHIWDACSGFEHRFVIGKKKPNKLVKPFIFDELEIQAPINGLYTALKHSKTDWILLLSCDLPLIDADVFQVLTLEGSVASRDHPGGTAPNRVGSAVAEARTRLAQR